MNDQAIRNWNCRFCLRLAAGTVGERADPEPTAQGLSAIWVYSKITYTHAYVRRALLTAYLRARGERMYEYTLRSQDGLRAMPRRR